MRAITSAFLLGLISLACTSTQAEETATVDAFSVWNAEGRIIQVAPDKAIYVGALGGPLFMETAEGPVPNGEIDCVGMIQITLGTGALKGAGGCTLKAGDGAKAFAEWSCEGRELVGCKGPFTISGGTDRLQGLLGDGSMTFRTSFMTLAKPGGEEQVKAQSIGIAFWRGYQLRLP